MRCSPIVGCRSCYYSFRSQVCKARMSVMHRLAFLIRTQLVSLRTFVPPVPRLQCTLAVRSSQSPAQLSLEGFATQRGRHVRCYASVGQQEVDLSTNAVKRRADELAGRLDDVIKVIGRLASCCPVSCGLPAYTLPRSPSNLQRQLKFAPGCGPRGSAAAAE